MFDVGKRANYLFDIAILVAKGYPRVDNELFQVPEAIYRRKNGRLQDRVDVDEGSVVYLDAQGVEELVCLGGGFEKQNAHGIEAKVGLLEWLELNLEI
ncbi:hypothetical protein FRC03_011433 [Tulasnella sp. 419]|nr:hypothetical protein FRC03_011433 [Tulasnella sp. 419]